MMLHFAPPKEWVKYLSEFNNKVTDPCALSFQSHTVFQIYITIFSLYY